MAAPPGSPPAVPPAGRPAARPGPLGYLQRAVLGGLMSVAALVLERRIRRALRSHTEPGGPAGPC